MPNITIGIIGATGYTGSELVRLLTLHPQAHLSFITSESHKGKKFSDIHPQFRDLVDIELISIKDIDHAAVDLVFLALPHGVSMDYIKEHQDKKYRIVDLSGDFRLPDVALYEEWYQTKHSVPEWVGKAAFGMPELFREAIREAKIVANPGCYPTSATLALYPLLKAGLIESKGIVVDAKSGVSGAGAKAKANTHFPDVFGNFSAYGLLKHRHTPEIQSTLSSATGEEVSILFTPHLLPVDRGILATSYSKPLKTFNEQALKKAYHDCYDGEPFVRVCAEAPQVKQVRGSNYCDVFATFDERTQTILTISVIDNLVKGAAGQAIQNMNIMFDFDEKTGLEQLPLCP